MAPPIEAAGLPLEQRNLLERLEQAAGLRVNLFRLNRTLGAPQTLPRELAEPDLETVRMDMLERNQQRLFTNANDIWLWEGMRARQRSMRLQGMMNRRPLNADQRAQYEGEFVLNNNETRDSVYLPQLLQQVQDFLGPTADRIRETLPNLPPGNAPGQRGWALERLRETNLLVEMLDAETQELLHGTNANMLRGRERNLTTILGTNNAVTTEAGWRALWGTNGQYEGIRGQLEARTPLENRKTLLAAGIDEAATVAARPAVRTALQAVRSQYDLDLIISRNPSLNLYLTASYGVEQSETIVRRDKLLALGADPTKKAELETGVRTIATEAQWRTFVTSHPALRFAVEASIPLADRRTSLRTIILAERELVRTALTAEVERLPGGNLTVPQLRAIITQVNGAANAAALTGVVTANGATLLLQDDRLQRVPGSNFEQRKEGLKLFLQEIIFRKLSENPDGLDGKREMVDALLAVYQTRLAHATRLRARPGITPAEQTTLDRQIAVYTSYGVHLNALRTDNVRLLAPNLNQGLYQQFLRNRLLQRLSGFADPTTQGANRFAQTIFIDISEARYNQIRDQMTRIARDETMRAEDKPRHLANLGRERRAIMEEMIAATDAMGQFQLAMGQMQEQWGQRFNLEGVRDNIVLSAPAARQVVEQSVTENERDRQTHSDRVLEHLSVVRTGLGPNALNALRDEAIMGFAEALDAASGALSTGIHGLLRLAGRVPVIGGLADRADAALSRNVPLELKDALKDVIERELTNLKAGQQVGGRTLAQIDDLARARDPNFNTRTDARKDDLRKEILLKLKMETTRTLLTDFNATGTRLRLENSVKAFKAMPNPAEFNGAQIAPAADAWIAAELQLDGTRVTEANVASFKTKAGGPTGLKATNVELYKAVGARLYQLLGEQLRGDWGTMGDAQGEGGTGYIGAYHKVLRGMERLIDDRLQLIGACFQLADSYTRLGRNVIIAGLAAPFVLAAVPIALGVAARLGVRGLRSVGWLKSMTTGRNMWRAGLGAGAALNGVRAYFNWREMEDIERRFNDERKRMIDQLYAAGFQGFIADGKKWTDATTVEADRYKATDFYFRPDGEKHTNGQDPDASKSVKVSVNSVEGARDLLNRMQMQHAAANVAEAGLLLNAMRLGVRGNIVTGVIIAGVEVGMAINEESKTIDCIRGFPPWLISRIDARGVFRLTHYELLETLSRGVGRATILNEAQSREAREKLFFGITMQELTEFAPLMRDIFPEGGHITELDEFFNGDFKNIMLPFILLCIHRRYGEQRMPWSRIGRAQISHVFAMFSNGPVGAIELKAAIREGAILYIQHRRELDYRKAVRLLADYRALPNRNPAREEMLVQYVESLRGQRVFGETIAARNLQTDGETVAERVLNLLKTRKNGNAAASQNVTGADNIRGLAGGFDVGDPIAIYNLVEDPVLREALRVASRFSSEGAGQWGFSWGRPTMFPEGYPGDPVPDEFRRAQFEPQQTVLLGEARDETRRRRLVEKLNIVSGQLRTRVQQFEGVNPSTIPTAPANLAQGVASHGLTVGLSRLFGTYRTEAERNGTGPQHLRYFTHRNPNAERDFNPANPGPPPYFFATEGVTGWRVADLDAVQRSAREISRSRLLAVFMEQRNIGTRVGYCTTMIFGDSPTSDNLTIMEYGDLVTQEEFAANTGTIDGDLCISNLQQFMGHHPHAAQMIQRLRTAAPIGSGGPGNRAAIVERVQPPAVQVRQGNVQPQGPNPAERIGAPNTAVVPAARALDGVPAPVLPRGTPERTPEEIADQERALQSYWEAFRDGAPNTRGREQNYIPAGQNMTVGIYMNVGGNPLILGRPSYHQRHAAPDRVVPTAASIGDGENENVPVLPPRTRFSTNLTVGQHAPRIPFLFLTWDPASRGRLNEAPWNAPPYTTADGRRARNAPWLLLRIDNITDLNSMPDERRNLFIAALTTTYENNGRERMGREAQQSLIDVINLCRFEVRNAEPKLSSQVLYQRLLPTWDAARGTGVQQRRFLTALVEVLRGSEINGVITHANIDRIVTLVQARNR